MSWTNLLLGHNWPSGEWPGYVEVSHEGVRDPGRRYVPERTCRMPFDDREYRYRCSRCGCLSEIYRDTDVKWYAPKYYTHCGARVVGAWDSCEGFKPVAFRPSKPGEFVNARKLDLLDRSGLFDDMKGER